VASIPTSDVPTPIRSSVGGRGGVAIAGLAGLGGMVAAAAAKKRTTAATASIGDDTEGQEGKNTAEIFEEVRTYKYEPNYNAGGAPKMGFAVNAADLTRKKLKNQGGIAGDADFKKQTDEAPKDAPEATQATPEAEATQDK